MLTRVARILRSNCRTSDYVARTGADEFVVLLASIHAEELAQRTEALDRMIRKAGLEICGEETPGISVGVACFPDDAKDPDSLLSYALQDVHRARRARIAGRGTLLQLEHSLERPA
jgi:diguanylate cyclase (GGDEF)-like protein